MGGVAGAVKAKLRASPTLRPFHFRDFRLLWTGAFLSFSGNWIQNVAQGWLVYELTGDKAKLLLVSLCGMLPVTFVGPIAGTVADTFNKRSLLIFCQSCFAAGALYLMAATFYGFVEWWHILVVALALGFVSALEMPTRQSIVSRVVPQEMIPAAIPLQAMTFNGARVLGPAIGGYLLAEFGPSVCYGINGFSYLGLILAVAAIRADLRAPPREPQPVLDLISEGMRYTFRHETLRTLFILEATVSMFGIVYMALLPAIAKEMLGLDERGLGFAYTAVGFGAMSGLITVAVLAGRRDRGLMVRLAMSVLGGALIILSFARSAWLAFPLFFVMGVCQVIQFNTTNTLFQMIAPERLRGRVLAMHIWALSGLYPVGLLLFFSLANVLRSPIAFFPGTSIQVTLLGLQLLLLMGAVVVAAGAVWGWCCQSGLKEEA